MFSKSILIGTTTCLGLHWRLILLPTTPCSPQVEASHSPDHGRGNISGPKEIWTLQSTIHQTCTITVTVKRTCGRHIHIDPLLGSGTTVPTGPSSSHTASGHPPLTPPSLDSHLKNGTTTNYSVGGRTESPRMSALHVPTSRQGLNGNGGLSDVDQNPMSAPSPRLGPPVGGLHPSKLIDRR